jgi:uncharacterized Zn-binding protein involved in type VI secretion
MPSIARISDKCSGHGCHPPRASDSGGSTTVTINGMPVMLTGSHFDNHTCGNNTHDGVVTGGSSTITVDGKAVAFVGTSVSCGSVVAAGSSNVFGS